jgi:hypothetical protein
MEEGHTASLSHVRFASICLRFHADGVVDTPELMACRNGGSVSHRKSTEGRQGN